MPNLKLSRNVLNKSAWRELRMAELEAAESHLIVMVLKAEGLDPDSPEGHARMLEIIGDVQEQYDRMDEEFLGAMASEYLAHVTH